MEVPRSDGTKEEGEDGEDGDGTVVVKCKEDVWHGSEDNGDVMKKMVCKGRDPSLWCQFVSSYSRALQTREKVGLTLATLLVI